MNVDHCQFSTIIWENTFMNATVHLPISLPSKLEWVQSAVQSAVQLIAPILILMTEKWATEQSCIHIEISSCKIPSLGRHF